MNKIEEFWVIQRNDGEFYQNYGFDNNGKTYVYFNDKLLLAKKFDNKSNIKRTIKGLNIQNCKPVKCEIRVVGE